MIKMDKDNIFKDIKGKIKFREPFKNYTTFKIGGSAKFFIEPKDIAELKLLLNLVKKYRIPILVIGAGSNILASDRGIDGIVLRLNSPEFKKLSFQNNRLQLGSGTRLSQVTRFAQEQGLSGLEFLAGIPATVGGALIMNAGADKKNIGDLVENITVMDYNNKIRILKKKDIKFGYRSSNLSRYIILNTTIKLARKNKKQIQEKIKQYLNYRKNTQDLSYPSAGCIFKNPKGNSAGRLIDLCGLKGKRIGDACVSERHANFIVNLGKAKASDVLELMDLVKKKVKDKFNITLEPEIRIWQ